MARPPADRRASHNAVNAVITSGPEVDSTILSAYHKKTIMQAAEAMATIRPENRDISSLTLSVSRQTYLEIKKEIQGFRKRLLSMARNDMNPEMVCFAGFQLLPKSAGYRSDVDREERGGAK